VRGVRAEQVGLIALENPLSGTGDDQSDPLPASLDTPDKAVNNAGDSGLVSTLLRSY
jgi:hypothetical protein